MSHDRTGKPIVCRDTSHEQGHEIQRQKLWKGTDQDSWPAKGQILADCQAEIHEFQADCDRKIFQKLNETIDSQKEKHRAQAEERRRQDQQLLHEPLLSKIRNYVKLIVKVSMK